MRKQQLQFENYRLSMRIQELEDRLCPYNRHTWIPIRTENCRGNTYVYRKCARCGKIVKNKRTIEIVED